MGDGGFMEPAIEVAIEIAVKKAKAKAEKETTIHCIRCLMKKLNMTVQQAIDILDVPADKQKEYLALI